VILGVSTTAQAIVLNLLEPIKLTVLEGCDRQSCSNQVYSGQ